MVGQAGQPAAHREVASASLPHAIRRVPTTMKKRSHVCVRTLTLVSLVAAGSAAAGCSSGPEDDMVSSEVGVISRSGSALIGEVKSIDGVYGADCAGHTENEAWSVRSADGASLTNPALRVRRNDASCTLKLTHLRTADGTFTAAPAIALSGTYPALSAFNDDAQTAVDFYGSAKLGDPSFASDFSIDLVFADPANDGEPAWKFPDGYEHGFTVTEGNVPAPDFGFTLSDHTLLTDEDDVVTTSSGHIQLTRNDHGAQTYAVVHGLLSHGMSPADLASAIQSAPHGGALASPYRIPAEALELAGVDITDGVARSIVLRNTDQGISSYQVIRLRFAPRPSWTASDWGACSAECGGGIQTRTLSCRLSGAALDPSYCTASPPATSRACNEDPCATGTDVGAFSTAGTCGVLGVLGPGFIVQASATEALPVGTTIDVIGAGVANIGVFSVTGVTATVTVLSPTARRIVLTSALPAGAQMALRTTLSITVAFSLSGTVTLPDGHTATGAKTAGSVTSTLVMCSAT